MTNIYDKDIANFSKCIAKELNTSSIYNVNKADYDRTLIGVVTHKNVSSNGAINWEIQVDGTSYTVSQVYSNITKVGQRVRLFIPNHNYTNKYAEVIEYGGDLLNKEDMECIYAEKVSDTKVYFIYQRIDNNQIQYKVTTTAEKGVGSNAEHIRKNFKHTIEESNDGGTSWHKWI